MVRSRSSTDTRMVHVVWQVELAAAMKKRCAMAMVKWKPAPMPLVEIERLFRANLQLAEAFENVRPTVALIERCHAALQKHGIEYRAW